MMRWTERVRGMGRAILTLGVPATASPAEAQRLTLINAMATMALAVAVLLIPLQVAREQLASVGVSLLTLPAAAGVLALQRRGRPWWAALTLSLVAVALINLQLHLADGRAIGIHYFLAPTALLPFLVFSPRHTGTAVLASLISSGSLVIELAVFHDARTLPGLFAAPGPTGPVVHVTVAMIVCVLGIFARRIILAAEASAELERARAEALLVRVFPRAIARRLKLAGKVPAERHADASVLFCRVTGIEAATPDAAGQLALLRRFFAVFDDLCDAHGVEKIKSFGASYMVASGVPEPQVDHAERLAALALELLAACASLRERLAVAVTIKIGVHSGPVVGGILGRSNLTFDLWGDTVNTAQRMEAHGLDGEIQLSAVTFAKINHRFRCEPREAVALKGKLPTRTYLLRGPLERDGGPS